MGLIATHRPRAEVAATPYGYRAVSLRTADGVRLAGWYARSRNGAAVISFPTRSGKLDHAAMLRHHGYGVLVVDMRGYDDQRGSPMRSVGLRRRTSTLPFHGCAASPMFGMDVSAGSASPSVAR